MEKNQGQLPVDVSELAKLAQRANEAHQRVAGSLQQAVANAVEVGGALLKAKELCAEGKFTAWLRANFKHGLSTARGYMRLAANWNQLEPDQQRAAGLSQRRIKKLLRGLPCYDGRGNPHASQLTPSSDAPEAVGLAPSRVTSAPPAGAATGDPLKVVERLLEEAVAELRRLARAGESYAEHVLQPLEYIRQGIPSRNWFWEIMPDNK